MPYRAQAVDRTCSMKLLSAGSAQRSPYRSLPCTHSFQQDRAVASVLDRLPRDLMRNPELAHDAHAILLLAFNLS